MSTLLLWTTALAQSIPEVGDPVDPPSGATPAWLDAVRWTGTVDVYAGLDPGSADDRRRPPFLYSHARNGGVAINLAMLGAEIEEESVRAAAKLMAGTFAQDNQGFEEPGMQYVYEARVGARIAGRTWVDAGVFPSHLGAESAIGLANPTLTRSLTAENSPYYLAGVKLGIAVGDRLELGVVAANGWQRIVQTDPLGIGGGSWVTYRASDAVAVNWSTWVGLEQPSGEVRLFSDLYTTVTLDRVDLIAWFDVGTQAGRVWAGGNLQSRVWLLPDLGLVGRVETYVDPDGVVVTVDDAGVRLVGGSVGVDVRVPSPEAVQSMWRTEYRVLAADDEVFPGGAVQQLITTSISLAF
jgi:hypothetical protein